MDLEKDATCSYLDKHGSPRPSIPYFPTAFSFLKSQKELEFLNSTSSHYSIHFQNVFTTLQL